MESKERYSELCRLCASYDAVKMDIFGNEGKNRQLVDKIQTCLPFKIAEDDRLPKCLCYRCMYNLENFYDFRTACVNAVALLERCLPSASPDVAQIGKEENGCERYSELRTELLKEKEKMPILIPEAPIVNPNAALGTPPRLNSDGEAEIEEIRDEGDNSPDDPGTSKTVEAFEDTEDLVKSDEYEMDMETNPSDFLEMTAIVSEDAEVAGLRRFDGAPHVKARNDTCQTFQHTSEQHEVYVCSLCNKAFSSKGHLSLHARIHVGAGDVIGAKVVTDDHTSYKRPYQCDLCNKSYSTAKHRWGHVSTTHRGHPAVTCAYCSRIYSTRTNLEEHIKSRHTGLPPPPELPLPYVQTDNRYRCKMCPKMYTNVTDLNKHTRVCDGEREKSVKKKVSDKTADRDGGSEISSTESDDEGKDYRNAEAKLSKNPQLTILKQALTKGEGIKREYEENSSWILAGRPLKLPRIERNEGETPRKRWYCEMCPRNFTTVDKLKEHEAVHDAERPYVCILCDKDFVLKTSLSRHIVSSHGVDPGPILESDRSTKKLASSQWRKKKSSLIATARKTREASESSEDAEISSQGGGTNAVEIETVFVCEICTRDFNDRASLWLHIRATHKELAAFACGVCLKICSDNAQLLNHVNVYHGGSKLLVSEQRRYSCTICGRQHDSRKKLMTHVSIHNVDPGYDPASFVQLNANYYNDNYNGNETNDHLMDFDAEDGDKVDCYICYKSFPNEDHLIRHQRNAHKTIAHTEPAAMSTVDGSAPSNGPSSNAAGLVNGTKAQYHLFFVCELCGSSHPSKWERWLHVSSDHSDDPSMRCEREDCGKIFATKALRNEHAQHHLIQGASPNTCEVCGKLWGSRVDYWKHVMGVHSDTVPLICGVCLKVFPDVERLGAHVKSNHWPLTNGDFSCDICGRPYSNKSKMSRHRKIHGVMDTEVKSNAAGTSDPRYGETHRRNDDKKSLAELNLTCHLCNETSFEDWQALCNHRRNVHGLFPCDLCNKCYGRTSHLWKHVNRVHKGHEDVTCRYCMKTSASKDHLVAHIAKIHRYEPAEPTNRDDTNDDGQSLKPADYDNKSTSAAIIEDQHAPHHCDKCQKSFHKRYLLRRHAKGCQNYRKDPGALLTRCRACERIFKDRASLQKHIENHHSEYTCHLCNETVTSKLGIMTHNRVNHLHHPDLTCENVNCKKLFRTKDDLESHRKDHKYHNSPNVCDFCGDTVDNKLKLKMHVLSLHRNEIGVSCGVCLIPMKDPKDLKKHVEDEHEGVLLRPNTCQVCGKRYASKWKAFDHTKKCHGKVFRTCKQCLAVFTSDNDIRRHYERAHNVTKDQLAGFESRIENATGDDSTLDVTVKNEPEDYEDDYCDYGYEAKRRKKMDSPDTHDCAICPEIFLNRETLSDHYRNVHNTDPARMFKRTKLETSVASSKSNKSNNVTINRRNDSERMMMRSRENFECKNCSRQFCTKSLFWNHINACTRRSGARDENRSSSILEAHLKNNRTMRKEASGDLEVTDNLNIPDFNLFEDINVQLSEQKPIPNLMPLAELRRVPTVPSASNAHKTLCPRRDAARKDSRKVYDESTNTVCVCEVCGKQWPAKKHLWQHLIRFHRAEAAVTCGVCLKLCTSYEQLASHLRSSHQSVLSREGNNFTCKTCGRYHNARSKLLLHMSIHINNGSGSGVAWCEKCERSFESEDKLAEHAVNCDKKISSFEEHDGNDGGTKNEEDKGSLIGDGASLTGDDEEEDEDDEEDFSDRRESRTEDSESPAASSSECESEDESPDHLKCDSRDKVLSVSQPMEEPHSPTDSRATGDVSSHSCSDEDRPSIKSSPSREPLVDRIKEENEDSLVNETEENPARSVDDSSAEKVRDTRRQIGKERVMIKKESEASDEDEGPPILSPMMPLAENAKNPNVPDRESIAAKDSPSPSDDSGRRSIASVALTSDDEDRDDGSLDQLDDEDSRIHVVNPDDEYHSDDSRETTGEREVDEENAEDDEEAIDEEEDADELIFEESMDCDNPPGEQHEDNEDDDDETVQEDEDEEHAGMGENSLQIHNLDGTVLMVANDADGNQILIQRNVSDMENEDSVGDLAGYIYEDEEYDFAGFQVETNGEEARPDVDTSSDDEEPVPKDSSETEDTGLNRERPMSAKSDVSGT